MNIQYISFDVYDTLIRRIFTPQQLYRMMEIKLKEEGCDCYKDFSRKRILAEKELRNKGNKNYSLSDVYNTDVFIDLTLNEKDKLRFLEEEYEIHNTLPNYYGRKLYKKYCKKYQIICVSDMYLDKRVIGQILKKNGYSAINKIYVSCEEEASKRETTLFLKVAEDLNISCNEILHVGDALRSDFINPKLLGMKSIRCHKSEEFIKTNDFCYDLGFNTLGPVMYGFCQWLHKAAAGRPMIFLAREGLTIQKYYHILYKKENTQSMFVSRRSVINGTAYILLQRLSSDEFIQTISEKRNETVEELFCRLGLQPEKYMSGLQREKINLSDAVSHHKSLYTFIEKNKKQILEDFAAEHQNFGEYLQQFCLSGSCLVDIGWKGSMQNILEKYMKAIGKEQAIWGLYFGATNKDHKNGYLFEENNKTGQNTFCFSGLLEVLMQPMLGSVTGYEKSNNEVQPVFDQCEFRGDDVNKIKKLQSGVSDFLNKCAFFEGNCQFDKQMYMQKLFRLGLYPSNKDIAELGNISVYENGTTRRLVEHASLLRFKDLKKKFVETNWKTAFLKKLFYLRLPYHVGINYLRRYMDQKGNQ